MRRLVPWMVVLAGCKSAPERSDRCFELPPPSGPVVARVGDTALSLEQLERRLREQGSMGAQKLAEPERLKKFVDDQVRFELLVQAARERGLDKDPQVVEAARNVMVRKLLQQDLGPQVFTGSADDAAVKAYYEAHLEDYVQPKKRRLAHIQLEPTPEGKGKAQSLVEKLKEAPPGDRKLFRYLAATHSVDKESRSRGGELSSFVSQEELTRALGQSFAEAAFALDEGVVTPTPVSSTRGWHVVVVLAEREAQARSLESVKDEIRDRLLQSERSQMFEKYLGEIRQRYPVALYEEQLPALLSKVSGREAQVP